MLALSLRAGRAIAPLAVAYAAGLWLLLALLCLLHVHRSALLGGVTALPAALLGIWFSRWERGRFDRRAVANAALRACFLLALFGAMVSLFHYPHKDRAAWAIWVPLMTLDFTPSMLAWSPLLALVCLVGLAVSHWLVVLRLGQFPFLVAYAWPGIWAFIAFTGFYRATFDVIDPGTVAAQPGVTILAASADTSCSLFAERCSARIFPRAVSVDSRTGRLFAGFGSTASKLVRGQPMLLALDTETGSSRWLPRTDDANQLRNVFVDEAERRLFVGQWGSHRVGIYDLDRLELVRTLPTPREGREEFQPIQVLAHGDRVFVVNIWYPRVIELSVKTGEVARVLDLHDRGLVGNGVQLAGAALSVRRGRIYVALCQFGDNLLELDLATLEPLRSVNLDVIFPGSFTYDDVSGRVFLSSFRSSTIEVVEVDGMKKVAQIEGAIGARETAIDPQRGLLFVMDYLKGEVLFHSLADGRLVRRVAVGPKPGGAVVFGGRLYVNATVGMVAIDLD